jgi:tricorn protease
VPLAGGVPERRTWNGDSIPAAWAPDGRLLVSTNRYSTLPDPELVLLDNHVGRDIVPLAEGSEAAYSSDGHTLFFTRWRKQPSFRSATSICAPWVPRTSTNGLATITKSTNAGA